MHLDPKSAPPPKAQTSGIPAWQRVWGESFRDLESLLDFLELDPRRAPRELKAGAAFPLRVPRAFAARMRKRDWNDPLLLQVLPLAAEGAETPGFTADAVGDGAAREAPGLLRKYRGRALLLLSGECAVHCRYCFRREYPYDDIPAERGVWDAVYARLAQDPDLEELIFSGGDPLSLSDARLRWHWEKALALPQARRIRIHTRLPVVLPERLDAGFLALASELGARRPLVFVLHINHPAEIDAALRERLQALRASGALLLNQSVLLRGVNDTVAILAELSRRLLDAGILPYYLHQLDRVRGAWHFEVPESNGLELMRDLRMILPGYALPRYVRETAGEPSKSEIRGMAEVDSDFVVSPFRFSF